MALHALPGYIYLKRPSGRAFSPAELLPAPERVQVSNTPPAAISPSAPPREVLGRLLVMWLEAVDGRRSPRSLKNGPFHPDLLAQLGKHQRLAHAKGPGQGSVVASKIKTLHIQKSSGPTVRFCAAAVIGGRVRAIAGTMRMGRVPRRNGSPPANVNQWRMETLQII